MKLDQYLDLIARLRSLARSEHGDFSIGDEAAELIQQLLDELDTLHVQSQPDVVEGWVCVPEEEWEQVMRRVWGEGEEKSKDLSPQKEDEKDSEIIKKLIADNPLLAEDVKDLMDACKQAGAKRGGTGLVLILEREALRKYFLSMGATEWLAAEVMRVDVPDTFVHRLIKAGVMVPAQNYGIDGWMVLEWKAQEILKAAGYSIPIFYEDEDNEPSL